MEPIILPKSQRCLIFLDLITSGDSIHLVSDSTIRTFRNKTYAPARFTTTMERSIDNNLFGRPLMGTLQGTLEIEEPISNVAFEFQKRFSSRLECFIYYFQGEQVFIEEKFYAFLNKTEFNGMLRTHFFQLEQRNKIEEIKDIRINGKLLKDIPEGTRPLFCIWKFKSPECGYKGSDILCFKSVVDCEKKDNLMRFGGNISDADKTMEKLIDIYADDAADAFRTLREAARFTSTFIDNIDKPKTQKNKPTVPEINIQDRIPRKFNFEK